MAFTFSKVKDVGRLHVKLCRLGTCMAMKKNLDDNLPFQPMVGFFL
jgi:hypothetical protein